MALKSFNPITPSLRGTILIDRSELWKGKPVKGLTEGKSHSGGRNNHGRITSRFRGGGHKQSYRIVDFKRRDKFGVAATVERLEYDPNRTAFIALLKYEDGELSYIIAPQRLKAGDTVVAAERADIKPGNAMPMAAIPVGTIIHNIEMKLMSGELRLIRAECMASIGAVSNPDNSNQQMGKAGRSRWLGRKPHNRGVTMNPIDHPHGGGEGRTSGGRHPVTPWGKPTKGAKTRNNKRSDGFIVRRRNATKG